MTAFLLYVTSHWTLIIAAVLVVATLSAASWFLKNWKYAAAAIAVAVVGFLYQGAVTSGIKEQAAKDLQVQADTYNGRIATMNTLTLKDGLQAQADDKSNRELETLASDTPKNDSPCLDAAAAHRVWAVRQAAIAGTTPVRSSRVSNVFPWRNRNP